MSWIILGAIAVAFGTYVYRINARARRTRRSLQDRPWWGQR